MRGAILAIVAAAALLGCDGDGTGSGDDLGGEPGPGDLGTDLKDALIPDGADDGTPDVPAFDVPEGTLVACPSGDVFAHDGEPCAGKFVCPADNVTCCGQKFSDGSCGCNVPQFAPDVYTCTHEGPPLECGRMCPILTCDPQTTCPVGWSCAMDLPAWPEDRCLPPADLCRACQVDADCGTGGACVDQGLFRGCATPCPAGGCPEGFECGDAAGTDDTVTACVPRGGGVCPNTCEGIHMDCPANQWGCDEATGKAWQVAGAPIPFLPTADWGCAQPGSCLIARYACEQGCRTDDVPWEVREDFVPDPAKTEFENPQDLPVPAPAESPWLGCAEAAPPP